MTPSDVKIVADNISDFIEIPDGIERLRKAVLTLAVAGKLVAQDKKEGTAEDLYTKILEERFGSKKGAKEFPQVDVEDMPFNIPKSWKWVSFGSLFLDYGSGSTPSRSNDKYYSTSGVNWYKSGELNDDVLPIEAKEKVSELALKECRLRIFKPKDFLIAMYGATAGRIAVSNGTGTTNQAVWSGTPVKNLDDRYLYYYILQSRQILIDKSSGAAQPNISGEKILAHAFALPPLEEQKRIVKKVEEVMNQLDELETKKRERDVVRTRLARSAMKSLGNGEFKIAFEHLTELVKTPADLKELEGALLTLAVSGRLVAQDKKEGTAEDLYKQIQEKRSHNVERRKKKVKDSVIITKEDIPLGIPKSWKWVRVSDIVSLITDGEHISPQKHTNGIPLVTAKNVIESGVTFENVDYVTKEDANKFWTRCRPEKGDLLICSRGTIGRTTVVNTEEPFCLMGSVILIKFYNNITSDLCKYYLRTQSGVSQIGLMRKGMAVGALYLKDIEKALIPLPPLAEQKRIVKKVEEIMVLIDHLKQVIGEK